MKVIVVLAVPDTQAENMRAWGGLTTREREVALLVGRALTNQQIARRLSISTHTVNYHLRHIFGKLGIRSRVSLAHFALSQTDVGAAQSGRVLLMSGVREGDDTEHALHQD